MNDMRTFVELVEKYINPEFCPYPEYKGKPYYSIKYIENGEEYVGYSTYSLRVMSEFLKKYFISSALEKQEQSNAQNFNSTHRSCPNALESLNILEQAKDEKGRVPMSLVRQAFRNVMEQDRWIPVTERLPEEDDYRPCYGYDDGAVWWLNDVGMMGLGWYYTSTENWVFYDEITHVEGIVGNVIAWRPLPEPYTEEEFEEDRNER